jgi:hypothetical protein
MVWALEKSIVVFDVIIIIRVTESVHVEVEVVCVFYFLSCDRNGMERKESAVSYITHVLIIISNC